VRISRLLKPIALCSMVVLFSGIALADNLTVGTTIPFQNGAGTLTGWFQLSADRSTITDWSLAVTQGAGFPAFTYNPADSTASITPFFGNMVADFFSPVNQFGLTGSTHLAIQFDCGGNTNCFQFVAPGVSFALDPDGSFEVGNPDLSPFRSLSPAFINVTDPPGTFALNLGTTVIDGNTLYGSSTPQVPEPSSIMLFGTVLLGTLASLNLRRSRR
jgi:hypothetical protein